MIRRVRRIKPLTKRVFLLAVSRRIGSHVVLYVENGRYQSHLCVAYAGPRVAKPKRWSLRDYADRTRRYAVPRSFAIAFGLEAKRLERMFQKRRVR